MKLISDVPIQILISLNLSRQKFGTAKSYIVYGERLKILEQRLFFLNVGSQRAFKHHNENVT